MEIWMVLVGWKGDDGGREGKGISTYQAPLRIDLT